MTDGRYFLLRGGSVLAAGSWPFVLDMADLLGCLKRRRGHALSVELHPEFKIVRQPCERAIIERSPVLRAVEV